MLFLFFSMLAHAAEMKCIAPFDDSSYYRLVAEIKGDKIQGKLGFSYVTGDGLDLRAKLNTSEQNIIPGKTLSFTGSDGNMQVKAAADYSPKDKNYQGELEISFNYDGTPPVGAAMTCD